MEFIKVFTTSLLSVVSLFFIAKIVGHKQMSQLDFFDYVTGITIGSIAAELATELDNPWKPLVAMIVYGGVSILLTAIAHKLPKTRKFINFFTCAAVWPKLAVNLHVVSRNPPFHIQKILITI